MVPQTIRNMIERGELPAVRIGSRRVRIQRSDLDAFLQERRRLSSRSETRVAFDSALETAAKALRSHDATVAEPRFGTSHRPPWRSQMKYGSGTEIETLDQPTAGAEHGRADLPCHP